MPLTPEEIKNKAKDGIKVYKILPENDVYTKYNTSDHSLIDEYVEKLDKEYELNGIDRKSYIYLVILKRYLDFDITIYPIDIEPFANESAIVPNNLSFINFQNYLTLYSDYESNTNELILVILLERNSSNSPINELNYYFYGMKRNNNQKGKFLNISDLNLTSEDSKLQSMYF